MDKDNKFLSAELKSLEDSLLSTLDKHSRVEKLSNEKVADLQKQLEHAQKALMVMKNAMVDTPDKSVMVDLEKKAALLNVYERQINELQASNAVLKSQLADNEDAFRKQLVVLDEKLKSSETERKSDNSLLRAQENEMVQMKANLADLETQLKVARVPDLAQVEQLRNQLKIEKDTSDSLRTRLKTSDVEKLEMSEQLVLANSDLDRHRQLLSAMKSKVEDLSQTKVRNFITRSDEISSSTTGWLSKICSFKAREAHSSRGRTRPSTPCTREKESWRVCLCCSLQVKTAKDCIRQCQTAGRTRSCAG